MKCFKLKKKEETTKGDVRKCLTLEYLQLGCTVNCNLFIIWCLHVPKFFQFQPVTQQHLVMHSLRNLAGQCFLNSQDLFQETICERAHRKSLDEVRPIPKKNLGRWLDEPWPVVSHDSLQCLTKVLPKPKLKHHFHQGTFVLLHCAFQACITQMLSI